MEFEKLTLTERGIFLYWYLIGTRIVYQIVYEKSKEFDVNLKIFLKNFFKVRFYLYIIQLERDRSWIGEDPYISIIKQPLIAYFAKDGCFFLFSRWEWEVKK